MLPRDQPPSDSAGVLVAFYLGRSTDSRGRTLDEIQSWDDCRLETVHDYIQWLFPLTEGSGSNPNAPVLDDAQIATFRTSDDLKGRLLDSFKVMLSFYGLECDDTSESPKIMKADWFELRKAHWLTPMNHNYLRITRILKSLQLLGLEEYARAFLTFLEQLYKEEGKQIGDTTFFYWKSALG
jgi:hypothetical protein